MTVTEKIREVLDWNGMSQTELSKRTGIQYPTLNGYLCGRHPISLEALKKIASALGVSVYLLMNEEPLPADNLELSESERQLVGLYRRMTDAQRDFAMESLKLIIRQNNTSKK